MLVTFPSNFAVIFADTTCYLTSDGRDYHGNVSITVSGLTCQRWDSQSPHGHINNDASKFPGKVSTSYTGFVEFFYIDTKLGTSKKRAPTGEPKIFAPHLLFTVPTPLPNHNTTPPPPRQHTLFKVWGNILE